MLEDHERQPWHIVLALVTRGRGRSRPVCIDGIEHPWLGASRTEPWHMRIVEHDMRQDMCLVLMASWRVKCVDELWIEVELRRNDRKSLRADVCGALETVLNLL